jgi:hypothetical protein
MVTMRTSTGAQLNVLDGSSWTSQPKLEDAPVSIERREPVSYTVTVDRGDFVKYFTELAERGEVDRLTLHMPTGVAYGMGLARKKPGVTQMDVQGRVTKFYVSSLVILGVILGVIVTLAFTDHFTVFESCLVVAVLVTVMLATISEWKGWRNRG